MPRKSKREADSQVEAIQTIRWRYLVRNPEFQTDINELRETFKDANGDNWISKRLDERERIADKWGLLSIPLDAVIYWPGVGLNADEVRDTEHYGSRFGVSYTPVESTELRDDRFLFFRVDLDYQADALLSLIGEELGQQKRARPSHRMHLDKVDFQLEVFDLAKERHSFVDISKRLGRPLQTIRRAYAAAAQKIFRSTEAPNKRNLTLALFDLESHWRGCAICSEAINEEDMCPEAREFANQDQKAQRELTGHDTTR